jgi:DNA-binding CsgD family transcriptional regulator
MAGLAQMDIQGLTPKEVEVAKLAGRSTCTSDACARRSQHQVRAR